MNDAGQIAPYRVQIDGPAQSRGERGHDSLGVVARPVEPAVDRPLHPPPQRVEQRRDGTAPTAPMNASAAGPPVPGWWVRLSSTTEAAPSPSVTTPSTTAAAAAVCARTIVLTRKAAFPPIARDEPTLGAPRSEIVTGLVPIGVSPLILVL
jgi:hypothetical protein